MNTNLGETVSAVERELDLLTDFMDDPITRASGCGDELFPLVSRACLERVEALLRARGYACYREFMVEVEDRTCDRWVHFYSGIEHLDDIEGVGYFARDAFMPDLFTDCAVTD
jgi:hypothetical protein